MSKRLKAQDTMPMGYDGNVMASRLERNQFYAFLGVLKRAVFLMEIRLYF